MHDTGDYPGAIEEYREVLAESPHDVGALRELALSYFTSKQYQGAYDTAVIGAGCVSASLVQFHIMMGNALDELGRSKEALEVYGAAAKLAPDVSLLRFNFGISLRRAGRLREAKAEFQSAIRRDPAHASSHLMLATTYRDLGYRIPAILAYTRFLILEAKSSRTRQAIAALEPLLTQGVSTGAGPNQINITIGTPSKATKDDGDFSAAEMGLAIGVAANVMKLPKAKPQTPFELIVDLYVQLGESLGNSKPKGGFAATYYAPYFAELVRSSHAEALVGYVWQTAKVDGSDGWLLANREKLDAFLGWSRAYQWQ